LHCNRIFRFEKNKNIQYNEMLGTSTKYSFRLMGIGRRKDPGSHTGKRRSADALNPFLNTNDNGGEEGDGGFTSEETEDTETIPFDVIVPFLDTTTNRRSKRIKRLNVNIIMVPEGAEFDFSSNESVNRNQLLPALTEAFVEVTKLTDDVEDDGCTTPTDDAEIVDNFADSQHPTGMMETISTSEL
jgi:hypothetical protein